MHIGRVVMERGKQICVVITPERRVGIAGGRLQKGRVEFNII